ncbi:Bcr/CflA family multidrug efflux MFS transporter [Rheinheimera sp.]|uniref:Bcr/CflA family multidrug efflux MFS transporter n=1 Tax=Rheinheimera sp. TaxID=1869214 RepID=UPI002FDDED02
MSRASPSFALILLFAAIIATTPLAIDMYLPAMPQLADSLHSNSVLVQQSLSIFLAFYSLGMLLFGPLADAIGRRPLALWGLTGFVLASLLLSQSDSIEAFLSWRALQALCGSAATVVVPGIIRALYQEHTAKGMSYVSMMMMLAPLLAPAIGSLVLFWGSWHWIFIVLAAYALLILAFSLRYLPEINQKAERQKLNFFGSYQVVFAHKTARPLIAISMFSSFSFFCFLTAVPFVYIDHFAVSEQMFSLLFGLNVLMLISANFINSRLVSRLGSHQMLKAGWLSALCFATGLVLVSSLDLTLTLTVLMIAPLMASLGLIATNADALILMAFPNHSGTATAVIGTLRFGAGAVAGPLLALWPQQNTLPFALLMLAGVLAISLARLFILKAPAADQSSA